MNGPKFARAKEIQIANECNVNEYGSFLLPKNYLTPSMDVRSSVKRDILIEAGTPSNIMVTESFIIRHVVNMTIIEKTKVQSGSAIFTFGFVKHEENRLKNNR